MQRELFSQHSTKTEYVCSRTDIAKYKLIKLSLYGTNLKGNGFYGDGELDCTHVTDGNGTETLTFTDFMGRTVLMRKSAERVGYSDTYSVYDSWGRPLIVLPPECSARIVTSTMNRTVSDKTISDFAYIYTYDNKLRLKTKKLPGCKPLRYVYDSENRVVFSQDGNLADASKMRFCFYDKLGREAVSGICNDMSSLWTLTDNEISVKGFVSRNAKIGEGFLKTGYQLPQGISVASEGTSPIKPPRRERDDEGEISDLFETISTSGLAILGTDGDETSNESSITLSSPAIHKVIYYDNYTFLQEGFESLKTDSHVGLNDYSNESALGQCTGCYEVVEGATTEDMQLGLIPRLDMLKNPRFMLSIYSYRKGGVPTCVEKLYPNGFKSLSVVNSSSAGLPIEEKAWVWKMDSTRAYSEPILQKLNYEYDRFGRILKVKENDEVIEECEYNICGTLAKTLYAGNHLRVETRDIRGALNYWGVARTGYLPSLMQNIYFGNEGATTDWNGRITAKTTSMSNIINNPNPYNSAYFARYDYKYTKEGFLKNADFSNLARPPKDFSTAYSYDRQGNLTHITRAGEMEEREYMDIYSMEINRSGNLISNVAIDNSDPLPLESQPLPLESDFDFAYDSNGNRTADPIRGIEKISWNWNGKPTNISLSTSESIHYRHSASGERITSRYSTIEGDNEILTARNKIGSFEFTNRKFDRRYYRGFYTDSIGIRHLMVPDYQGNIVAVINLATNKIEQFTDYYPYGLPHASAYSPQTNRYKFGAKELTTEGGAYLANFEARLQSPFLGDFLSPDPKAEDYLSLSPWSFCAGDSINYVDPTGERVYLYATKLPGVNDPSCRSSNNLFKRIASYFSPTHTFLVVERW